MGLTGLMVCIGNHMDESVIWEKIPWQQDDCTRQSRVLVELFVSSQNFTLSM